MANKMGLNIKCVGVFSSPQSTPRNLTPPPADLTNNQMIRPVNNEISVLLSSFQQQGVGIKLLTVHSHSQGFI